MDQQTNVQQLNLKEASQGIDGLSAFYFAKLEKIHLDCTNRSTLTIELDQSTIYNSINSYFLYVPWSEVCRNCTTPSHTNATQFYIVGFYFQCITIRIVEFEPKKPSKYWPSLKTTLGIKGSNLRDQTTIAGCTRFQWVFPL